jgi:hypothetical protein
MPSGEKGIFCHMCGRRIEEGKTPYIVRIEVFAAGDPPEKLLYLDENKDFQEEIDKILEEISNTDPQELEDQVYKFFKFYLCRSCQREYIKNPFGRR